MPAAAEDRDPGAEQVRARLAAPGARRRRRARGGAARRGRARARARRPARRTRPCRTSTCARRGRGRRRRRARCPPTGAGPTSMAGWASSSAPSPVGSAGSVHTSPSASAASTIVPRRSPRRQPARVPSGRGRWRAIGTRILGADASVAAGVAPAAGAAVVGVLGRARRRRAGSTGTCPRVTVTTQAAVRRRVVEGELQLLELDRHRRVRYGLARSPRMASSEPCRPPPTLPSTTRPSKTPSTPWRTATARSAPGSARAALRHRVFRRVFIGAFLSNIGSWMQNVVLGALAYDLYKSPDVRRRAALRPARTAAALLARRRHARRRLRPSAAARHGVAAAGRSCRSAWRTSRSTTSPSKASLVGDRVPHRHGPGGVRPDLQRAAPGPRRPPGPPRRHLAQLGADERLPRDRPDHRRRHVRRGRRRRGCSW